MKKEYKELTFTDDFMFCRVLEDNPDVTKELLELILGEKIESISKPVIQKHTAVRYDKRGVRFDAYVESGDIVYDIEMQVKREPDIAKRSRYYHSVMDIDQLDPNDKFRSLKTTYVIFICKNRLGDDYDKPIYTFTMRAKEELKRQLGDGTITVLVNPYCRTDGLSEKLVAFLEYIRTGKTVSDDKFTEKIERIVEDARSRRGWEVEYMTLGEMLDEAKDEGRAEGKAETLNKVISAAKELGIDAEALLEKLGEKADK